MRRRYRAAGNLAHRAGASLSDAAGALPDIATVAEFVPGYEASIWAGVGAPKATPAEIVDKLNKEINAALADPKKPLPRAGGGSDSGRSIPVRFRGAILVATGRLNLASVLGLDLLLLLHGM